MSDQFVIPILASPPLLYPHAQIHMHIYLARLHVGVGGRGRQPLPGETGAQGAMVYLRDGLKQKTVYIRRLHT